MPRSPRKPTDRPAKCKPGDPPRPPEPDDQFERPWHAGFLADALRTADIPGALGRAAVGWGDYLRSRRDHPAFLVACQELDLVIRTALYTRLEAMAAAGDPKSTRLLNGGLAEIRRTLVDAGVDPFGPRGSVARKVPELHQVGSIGVPSGPCVCCARGLMIYVTDDEGRFQHVLVRHEVMEGIEGIEPYPDTLPTLRVVHGHVPSNPRGVTRFWEIGPAGEIRPEYLVPALDGPTRDQIWMDYIRRHPERAIQAKYDILDQELAVGETPTPAVAHRYELAVDQAGRPIHRLKPGDTGEIDIDGR